VDVVDVGCPMVGVDKVMTECIYRSDNANHILAFGQARRFSLATATIKCQKELSGLPITFGVHFHYISHRGDP